MRSARLRCFNAYFKLPARVLNPLIYASACSIPLLFPLPPPPPSASACFVPPVVCSFVLVNEAGERTFAKFHIRCDGGVKCLTSEAAQALAGADPDFLR